MSRHQHTYKYSPLRNVSESFQVLYTFFHHRKVLCFLWAMCLTVLLCVVPSAYSSQEEGPNKLHYIKAAFVYNFAKFVEWPPTTYQTEEDPIVLCVIGEGPITIAFDSLRGKKLHNRRLEICHITSISDINNCHILFVTKTEKKRIKSILDMAASKSILTIGDMEGFVEKGGIIELVMDDRKIRFNVNIKAAQKAQLAISSRLLKLARKIIR